MPEFNGEEWRSHKGDLEIETEPRHMVDIWVSCTKTVQVLGVPGTPGTSAIVLRSGTEFRFRGPVKNFRKIVIRGTGETPFGVKVRHKPMQNGEPLSDEKAPVISLGEPSNLVAKMRRLAAEHHARNRVPVLEPEDGPSFNRYEYEDDEELLFEEEWLEKKQKQREEAKARKEAEATDRAKSKSPTNSEPSSESALQEPQEPTKSPPKGNDPPAAKAAE